MCPVLKKGMKVTHKTKTDWGIGEILEVKPGGTIVVMFFSGGEYTLTQGERFLLPVETTNGAQKPPLRLNKGDRIYYKRFREWGMAEVLEDSSGEHVKVFFAKEGKKLLKADSDVLERVVGKAATDSLLDNLSYSAIAKKTPVDFYSPERAISRFLEIFPKGFFDPTYLVNERDYKSDANLLMLEILGKSVFADLLERGEYAEVCARALKVANKTNLIFPNEKMTLKDSLSGSAQQKLFSDGLYNLLFGHDLAVDFTKFAKVLEEIEAAKWTIISYYLFLARPGQYMFVKPTITQNAAEMMRFEIYYRPQLNWETYNAVLKLSELLFDRLQEADLKPRDMIDVQSFMWSIVAY